MTAHTIWGEFPVGQLETMNCVKSPVLSDKQAFKAWVNEEFPDDDFVIPSQFPFVMIAFKDDDGRFVGSEIVRYSDFQISRYQINEEEQ